MAGKKAETYITLAEGRLHLFLTTIRASTSVRFNLYLYNEIDVLFSASISLTPSIIVSEYVLDLLTQTAAFDQDNN